VGGISAPWIGAGVRQPRSGRPVRGSCRPRLWCSAELTERHAGSSNAYYWGKRAEWLRSKGGHDEASLAALRSVTVRRRLAEQRAERLAPQLLRDWGSAARCFPT
jgi:hypothetical protein